jgi:hypothetical protein
VTTAVFISRLVLAAVLFAAALTKMRSLRRFSRSVRAVADLAGIGIGRVTALVPATVVGFEFAIAVLLVSGYALGAATAGAFALAASFVGISILAIAKRQRIRCNCFGRSAAILGPETLLRAMLLLVPIGVLAAAAAVGTTGRWPTSPTTWVSSLALSLGALLLLLWASQAIAIGRLVLDRRAQPEPRGPRVSGHRPLQELRI